jgi:hypothetical protein
MGTKEFPGFSHFTCPVASKGRAILDNATIFGGREAGEAVLADLTGMEHNFAPQVLPTHGWIRRQGGLTVGGPRRVTTTQG